MTILGLTRSPDTTISGRILLDGRDLNEMSTDELRGVRGREIAMIFQDPLTSLHPFYRVGEQLVEAMQAHQDVSKQAARRRAMELLGLVGIPDAERRIDDYPHEFSGGMRQRAMIAMALDQRPEGPDRRRADHRARRDDPGPDPGADRAPPGAARDGGDPDHPRSRAWSPRSPTRINVMYAGHMVETGTLDQIFYDPQHPYTWGLLGSIARPDRERMIASRRSRVSRRRCSRRRRAAISVPAVRTRSTAAPRCRSSRFEGGGPGTSTAAGSRPSRSGPCASSRAAGSASRCRA